MAAAFHSFVVFAEMRTGSNFLEVNLNAIAGITCHGEAFNPHFIGYPNKTALLDVPIEARDENPVLLLDKVQQQTGLAGFRFFHDHDPRILDIVLSDPDCAKIILTRNPIESYVSWKIAQKTGQWKLTDIVRRKKARIRFDPVEFSERVEAVSSFQRRVAHRLQISGQTAFRLTYDDLRTVEVINGLAAFLGAESRLQKLDQKLKVQNPEPLSEKVSNFDELQAALSSRKTPDIERAPDFEPLRSASVPSYILAAESPLLYMPIRVSAQDRVKEWLADLDAVSLEKLQTQMSQKELRNWKRAHKGHRSFTVVEHPVQRAYFAYCRHFLGTGPEVYVSIRNTLTKRYGVRIPVEPLKESPNLDAHRTGFMDFLTFLKSNLKGQTALRVDPAWCTQAHALQGFSRFAVPDLVLRAGKLCEELPDLARKLGRRNVPDLPEQRPDKPFSLAEIYDDDIEYLAASVYQRDYMMFGFECWNGV